MNIDARDVIRRLRRKLSLTQEEFAHAIAVTVSTVNRWENRHAAPSKLAWKVIRELARRPGLPNIPKPESRSLRRWPTGPRVPSAAADERHDRAGPSFS